jgi:beta-glucosidase
MNNAFPFHNPTLELDQRLDDLISNMTLAEKVSQMLHESPAIERLGIPAYNWWNECLHGVARAGVATVFPQATGLAAMWHKDFLHEIAQVIAEEARAKHHEALRNDEHDIYQGLTFWSPNVNIFRDPRWGRGQETYGEDPYLTAQLGVAFVRGLQEGDDQRYLKTAACAKHYAVHSGPEADRHHFNAEVTARELWDTYLPAFEALVREAQVEIAMGAYNRTNGEPCCASPTLLQDILRERWGFDGHVTSDCWAIMDLYKHHHVVETREEAAAIAVKVGCDLNCGCTFDALLVAVNQGLIDEATIDRAVRRLFRTRIRLGMFDPPAEVPYAQIPYSVNDAPAHRALARRAAQEAIVLLKNDGVLPLAKDIGTIAVIGPNADDEEVLWGSYNGVPSATVTPLVGIRNAVSASTRVIYAQGCALIDSDTSGFAEALAAVEQADVTLFIGGISQLVEGEGKMEEDDPAAGDRTFIDLPSVQQDLLKQLYISGKPIILILLNGGPVSIPWAAEHNPAIIEAWYPGEEGGTAIADVLFGDYNPAGRLPVTVYRSLDDLPPFEDYSTDRRTYRYYRDEPLYRFGYGLSYTTFDYDNLHFDRDTLATGQPLTVSVDVQNTGDRAGDEVVQVYVRDLQTSVKAPRHSLQGFQRIHLAPGESHTVTFDLDPRQFALVNDHGQRMLERGTFEIFVGGGQPDDPHAHALSRLIEFTDEPFIFMHLYGQEE